MRYCRRRGRLYVVFGPRRALAAPNEVLGLLSGARAALIAQGDGGGSALVAAVALASEIRARRQKEPGKRGTSGLGRRPRLLCVACVVSAVRFWWPRSAELGRVVAPTTRGRRSPWENVELTGWAHGQ
jgi:hypothetical protein